MTITTTFDPPLLSDSREDFDAKAFAMVADLNSFATEANALQADVNAKQASAATAALDAGTHAAAANAAKNAAESAWDNFDDRYLGPKASNPTLDNDGNALLEGALYWNTTAKEMRAWNGTAWVTASAANAVSRSGDTMTGALNLPSNGLAVGTNQLVVSGANVGVGTSPGYRLHIKNSAATSTVVGANVINRIEANGSGADVTLQFSDGVSFSSFISQAGANLSFSPSGGAVLAINAAGLGYGAGSGGTASQPGQNGGSQSKSNSVTLNKPSGQITTGNASLAAGATEAFIWLNSAVTASDVALVSINESSPGSAANYRIKTRVGTGAVAIYITNESGGSLSDTLLLNVYVGKGSAS